MVKVGVVLSGCGVFDGAEIHESVCTLLSLSQAGAEAVCMAPDIPQRHVVNHQTGEVAEPQERNILVESARIARGEVLALENVDLQELDALIFPGGFGVAKNLCDFAFEGTDCSVDPAIEELILKAKEAGLPLGFLCISPALAAKVLGPNHGVGLTIGQDAETAAAIETMGCSHVTVAADEIHVDEAGKVVSSPAYMSAGSIAEVAKGVDKLVQKVLELV